MDREQFAIGPRGATYFTKCVPIHSSTQFDTDSVECGDYSQKRLLLIDSDSRIVIAAEPELLDEDLEWLKSRFNEWLGWEFPFFCVDCGHELTTKDVNWPNCCVACSECHFQSPAPEPFDSESLPAAPPHECPSCHIEIPLRELNRKTGGCRCRSCGWVSETIPALRFDGEIRLGDIGKALVEAGIAVAFQNSE